MKLKYPDLIKNKCANVIRKAFQNGVFFIGANKLPLKMNWNPNFVTIPMTKKSSLMHAVIFLLHDFGHLVFKPDIIYTTNYTNQKINDIIYIINRMLSESNTILFADGMGVDVCKEEYIDYEKRKIYPLYEHLKNANIKEIMHANAFYTILGDDCYLKKLLRKCNDDDEKYLKGLNNLEEYKKKYSRFFIGDYRWTVKNMLSLKKSINELNEWYNFITPLIKKYNLNIKDNKTFIDLYKNDLPSLNNYDNIDIHQLISEIFEINFNNNILPVFNEEMDFDNTNFLCEKNNIIRAFVQYMIGQLYACFKFKTNYSKRFFDIIYNEIYNIDEFINLDINLQIEEIYRIRSIYEGFMMKLLKDHHISKDEYYIYCETFFFVDPVYINYDDDSVYNVSLEKVAYNILNNINLDI